MTRIITKVLTKMAGWLNHKDQGREDPKLPQIITTEADVKDAMPGAPPELPPYHEKPERGSATLPPYEEYGDPDIQEIEPAMWPKNEETRRVAVVAMAVAWVMNFGQFFTERVVVTKMPDAGSRNPITKSPYKGPHTVTNTPHASVHYVTLQPRARVPSPKVEEEEEEEEYLSSGEKFLIFYDKYLAGFDRWTRGAETVESMAKKKHFLRRRFWRVLGVDFLDTFEMDRRLFGPGGVYSDKRGRYWGY